MIEPRRRKSSTVTFSVPDDHYHHPYFTRRTSSFAESDLDYEPTLSTINPSTLIMARALRSIKTFKKSWDSDKALTSTYKGKFGKHQLRAYILLALGYAIIVAWLAEMPVFALLQSRDVNCSLAISNSSSETLRKSASAVKGHQSSNIVNASPSISRAKENYSREYGRTVFTDFSISCNKTAMLIPNIVYIVGLILGGLIFGYIADHSGRKMILLGSMWTACALSIFQLLSEDYISYVFFILFVGVAIGSVQAITVPFVIEMFPIKSRAIYGLLLTGFVFLFDLIIPGLAFAIKNWKILQAVISAPLIVTGALYWFTEESMFWYTSQKDYVTAVLSLEKIARSNGINFEDIFREARDFLRGKRSKGVQCDFQPLLRLEDIKSLGSKYPDFDMVDLQATTDKKKGCTQRLIQILTGHHYYPTLSTFYPTDFLNSPILTIYLLIMCGLWLVSSLTEYSLESPELTGHLTDNFYLNYFYRHLIQVASFIIAFPIVYRFGRRWPTFCFFLIAEVCLLVSGAISPGDEHKSTALVAYFVGKFTSRGGFFVILLYTCEIFPTGLRCTTVGICYAFRIIGMALASPAVASLNERMPRLVYGILSLILGSMALLLPETKKFPLPRTIVQVEVIPTSISKNFRRHRTLPTKRSARPDTILQEGGNTFNDGASSVSGLRSVRFGPYDNQSTLRSVYELQEYGQDDTLHSSSGRNARRMDLRNLSIFQPYAGNTSEAYRQTPIEEAAEYDEDVDDDRTRYAQQQRLNEQQSRLSEKQSSNIRIDDDKAFNARQSSNDLPSQLDAIAPNHTSDITGDRNTLTGVTSTKDENFDKFHQDENSSRTPTRIIDEPRTFPPTMSEDENYFSEHC